MTTTGVGMLCGVLMAVTIAPAVRATPEAEESAVVRDHDPLERMNRGIFWFNEQVDRWALEPVATAWDFVAPDPVQTSLKNFLTNVAFPIGVANNLLQGKPKWAGVDVARFAVNTTVGIGGFWDPASEWGLEHRVEDFGQTLGVWGVPAGPYLVLPLFGPSSIRDGVGLAVDSAARVWPWFAPFYVSMGVTVGNSINERSLILDEVDEARAASLDFYSAVRSAYLQQRRARVADSETAIEDEDDTYFFEESPIY